LEKGVDGTGKEKKKEATERGTTTQQQQLWQPKNMF